MVDKRLELKTLLPADALVTVSPLWAEELRALHKREEVYTITNGFDPDKMSKGQINLTSKFTITYTGNIYTEKQDTSKLFAALRDLISDGTIDSKDVEVTFYGPKYEWLASEIEEYGLSNIVKQYGMIPQQSVLEKQRQSQVLLLLNWEDEDEKGVYPLKVFEYLAVQRPILATGGAGEDVIKELLDETKAGVYAKDVEDTKDILGELYLEYKSKGEISSKGNIEKINKYSYREMAKKFAEVLELSI
jgi:glycosyltransferase involved in cell wall biosynthesis